MDVSDAANTFQSFWVMTRLNVIVSRDDTFYTFHTDKEAVFDLSTYII